VMRRREIKGERRRENVDATLYNLR